MPIQAQVPQNTFVIRFWWELLDHEPTQAGKKAAAAEPRWHAHIDHIQSGEAISARDAKQLMAFIQRFVDIRAEGDPSTPSEVKPE